MSRSLVPLVLLALALSAACQWRSGTPGGEDVLPLTPTRDSTTAGGVYVPRDLPDAFAELDRMLPADFRRRFAADSTQPGLQHFGLGLWLRNNWGLWSGSRLATYLHDSLGLRHPDDMSGLLLDTYWRSLNGRPLEVAREVAAYDAYWRVNRIPPDSTVAGCAGRLEWRGGMGLEAQAGQARFVHLATCRPDGSWWAYEVDRGWYRPDTSLVRRFTQPARERP
jgi:hypothetical protein